MSNIQFNGEVLHYLILTCADGSARLQCFASDDALNLYLEKIENRDMYDIYDLSEGGSFVSQEDVDNAMTQSEVEKEFA